MAGLRVTLAGAVTLAVDGSRVGPRAFAGRQLPLVAAMLVLERDRPVTADAVAAQLWPFDPPPAHWRVAVRGLVSQFRRLLHEAGWDGDAAVRSTGGAYHVRLGDVEVDLEVAAAQLTRARDLLARGDASAAAPVAAAARAVVSRPVLPGIDAPWARQLRAGLRRDHLDVLDLVAACRRRSGDPTQAVTAAEEAITLDPFRESSWRELMQAHAACGNAATGLQVYERCRRALADELGVSPDPATRRVHAELLSLADEDPGPGTGPREAAGEVRAARRPPYRGLLAFHGDDAAVFFGRDAQVQELIERLGTNRVVTVVGPSGSGKSSLVRAGLLPALARGALPDSDSWQTGIMLPGPDPAAAWRTTVGGLARTRAPRLLVVDQFEELFTGGSDEQVQESFLSSLVAATRDRGRTRVVLTLRADFYDHATRHADLADLLSTSQYVVPPLDGDQLEAAIVGPARATGLQIEDGLVGRILSDVVGEPGALPLLQHALLELWHGREDGRLTHSSYDRIGGVAGAIATRAEAVHAALSPEEAELSRWLFLRLVAPGRDTGDARRRVPLDTLRGVAPVPTVDALVERLSAARLITTGADAPLRTTTVEVAHEALITAWPRLRRWVDEARTDLQHHQRLAEQVQTWVDHDRHRGYLLTGAPLADARLLQARSPGLLSQSEHDFVTRSATTEDDQLREREHRRRLERARSLARDSTYQVAEDQDLALLLAMEAVTTMSDTAPPSEAVGALHHAITGHRVVRSIERGGVVTVLLPDDRLLTSSLPHHELALWDVSQDTAPCLLDRGSLPDAVDVAASTDGRRWAEVFPAGLPTTVWDLTSGQVTHRIAPVSVVQDCPCFDPTGRLLAIVNREHNAAAANTVSVHDLEDHREVQRIAVPGIAYRTAIGPDGTWFAVADWTAPVVRCWDLATGQEGPEIRHGEAAGSARGLAFLDDRRLVVLTGPPFEISEHDLTSGDVQQRRPVTGSAPWDLAASAHARTVVVLSPGEVVEVHDLGSERSTPLILPGTAAEGRPSVSADGTRVAAGSRTGRSIVWDVRPEACAEVWSAAAPAPWTGHWVADGIVSTHHDGTLRRFENGRQVAVGDVPVSGPGGQGWWMAASPDGRYVAANAPPRAGKRAAAHPLGGEGRLVLRDAHTLQAVREVSCGGFPCEFSADGTRLLTASWELGVHVVDVSSGKPIQHLDLPIRNVPWATFLPDGRHVVVRHWDGELWVWDLREARVVAERRLAGQGMLLTASPAGHLLAAPDWSHDTVEVIDVDDLRRSGGARAGTSPPVRVLPRQQRVMATFSIDGTRLATASPISGDVTIWDAHDGTCLARIPHDGGTGGAHLTPDGTRLVVTLRASDGRHAVRLYTTDTEELLAMGRRRVRRAPTAEECETYGLEHDLDLRVALPIGERAATD